MAPKITVLMYTARVDYPYVGHPDWHCFHPVTQTLASQTFKDFELVVVDMLWESRQDWFEHHPQPFPVKHVPSSPNYWHERSRPGLCAQINRGFAWADGELIWMCGENNMFPSTHLAAAWRIHKKGLVPTAWYAICRLEEGAPVPSPVDFNLLGFTPSHIQDPDHRSKQFVDNPNLQEAPCHHQNYFGYSGVPTEGAIKVNGFDELFDGQWGLFDCDFGSRLNLHGYSMEMARDLFVIEPPVIIGDGYNPEIRHYDPFKCHYAIYLHSRATNRQVNLPLAADYVEQVKKIACFDQCSIKQKCAAGAGHDVRPADSVGESAYYPFCEGKNRQLAADWFASPPVRDLRAERELRQARQPPYDRGFIR